jgi:hypothetical protein
MSFCLEVNFGVGESFSPKNPPTHHSPVPVEHVILNPNFEIIRAHNMQGIAHAISPLAVYLHTVILDPIFLLIHAMVA